MKKFPTLRALIIVVLMYFQLNAIYYHLGDGNRWWVVILILLYPVYLLNRKFMDYWQDADFAKERKFKNLVTALVLSGMFYIGLFLIYLNAFTFEYVKAFIGYLLFLFVLLFVLSCSVNSVNWKRKDKRENLFIYAGYFLIPASVYIVGLAACYPAILSPDSLYVWSQVVNNGPYNNLHPIIYTLFVRLLHLIGLDLFGVMLLQCLLAAFAYAYIAYRFNRLGLSHVWCIAALILLTVYPPNLFNTLTFWKDIPYTIGISLLTIEMIRFIKNKEYFKKPFNIVILCVSVLLVLASRHNGVFVIGGTLLTSAVIYLAKKDFRRTIRLAIAAVAFIIIYYGSVHGSIALLGEKYHEPEDNKVTLTARYGLRMQGMVTLYAEKWDSLSAEDQAFIDAYIDLEELDAHLIKFKAKEMWQYWSRTKVYANAALLETDPRSFNRGYIKLLKKYPYEMITSYLKTTAIIWSAPEAGYTSYSAHPYAFRDEASMEKYSVKINDISYLPMFKEEVIFEIYKEHPTEDSWYAALWRPALFMLGILFFLWQGIKRKGAIAWIVALPALLNSVGYFVINEAQDARYAYINFTVFLIMAGWVLMENPTGEGSA